MQRDLPEMLRDYCSSSCDSSFEPGSINGRVSSENCSLNRQQTSADVSYMSSRLSNGVHCQSNSLSATVVLSTKSTALTEPTREDVSCVVRGKERLLGYAYLKNEIYVEYVCADGTSYKPGDSVYMERGSRRDTFETFNICTIQDFFRNKRDNCLYARVKGFHRLNEIPAAWYPYFQDRNNIAAAAAAPATTTTTTTATSAAEVPAKDPTICNRELVFSDTYDAYPVSALRGISNVRHYRDHLSAKAFEACDDCFYYIFWKNSYGSVRDKELASTQGEIRVGSNYQARLPPCQPPMSDDERKDTDSNPEWSKWTPKQFNGDLNMFITAARSMHAYRTICSSGIMDDGDLKMTVYKDECTQKALDALHKMKYNLEDALHELMKNPEVQCNPASKWTDDEAQRFVRGIRKHGKNFYKIQKEFLSTRKTAQCIEYFYLWKKTPAGLKVLRRPAAGSQKRTSGGGLRRIKSARGPNRTLSSDFVDCSPSSGEEERESDDSDKDLSAYQCSNCSATESKEWHHTTKDKTTVLCSDCRLFYKKYGELRPTEERENNAPSASTDKATDENNENVPSEKTGPTTRRAVGRPKSACAVTSPDPTDKNRRSPGNVSTSSVESKKKAKTSKVKSEKDATSPTPSSTTTDASLPAPSVIEPKTSSSDMDIDVPPEPTSAPSSQHKPPLPQQPDVKPSSPTTGIQKNMSALDVHPHNSGPQVKTEPVDAATEPAPDAFLSQAGKNVDRERLIKREGSEEGSSRSSSQLQHMPPALRENSPEPKPEHAQCYAKDEYSLVKIWFRNDNSCARTDLIFKANASSKLSAALQARLTDQAPSKPSLTPNKDTTSSSSSSSKTSKSPAPGKDEKRTVPATAGRQSTGPAGVPSSERDRDNRSTGGASGRAGDTPSRLSFPPAGTSGPVQRQLSASVIPGLSPDLGLPPGHPGVNPFAAAAAAAASANAAAQMPPGMFGAHPAERMRMMENLERERMMQAARAGVPGAAAMMQQLSPEMQMMESLRQREMMANLYPHLAGPQVAAAMAAEAQQQQQAAQQQQRDLMALAAAGILPGHPGGLHPALQQEMANREQAVMYQQLAMAAQAQAQAAGQFGGPHFQRGPNPGEMLHMLGRQPSIEDQMMMAQFQHNHNQRLQEEQVQQHQLQQLFRTYGQSGMPNPDFMRN